MDSLFKKRVDAHKYDIKYQLKIQLSGNISYQQQWRCICQLLEAKRRW